MFDWPRALLLLLPVYSSIWPCICILRNRSRPFISFLAASSNSPAEDEESRTSVLLPRQTKLSRFSLLSFYLASRLVQTGPRKKGKKSVFFFSSRSVAPWLQQLLFFFLFFYSFFWLVRKEEEEKKKRSIHELLDPSPG